MLGVPPPGRRALSQSPTVCSLRGRGMLPGSSGEGCRRGGGPRPPRGRAGRTERAALRSGEREDPCHPEGGRGGVSLGWCRLSIVSAEFISPSSLYFCRRVSCCVPTPGHLLSTSLGSPPACVSLPGVLSSHTLLGSFLLVCPDPRMPTILSDRL